MHYQAPPSAGSTVVSGPVVRGIRGAIQVELDTSSAIHEATAALVEEVIERNALIADDIVSILFTATPDLTSEFPALAAREAGLTDVPLMCAVEIDVAGAMPRVIRMLAHVNWHRPRSAIRHTYLRGATSMRPDLVGAGGC